MFALLPALLVAFVVYVKWKFSYWRRKNFPDTEARFPFGNMHNFLTHKNPKRSVYTELYKKFKSQGHKHAGLYVFLKPVYFPIDPELIKRVMSIDFDHFVNRGGYYNEKDDPLSAHLINVDGQKWRKLRTRLTPSFTSGKIKTMFATLTACGEKLRVAIGALRDHPGDLKDIFERFTVDVIGSCAFGIECNSFEEPNSEFIVNARRIFTWSKTALLKHMFVMSSPKMARVLKMTTVGKEVTEFFMQIVRETVEFREEKKISRGDFMQLLINLQKEKGFDLKEIAAQAFVFFAAGFETSSTILTFCLYELAVNLKMQDELRSNLKESLGEGEISYERLKEIKYLNQVVLETLRMYPTLAVIPRTCVKEYRIPNSDLVLEEGTRVFVPVYALHHDPDYFPEPEKFDPDRFKDKKPAPFTFLPFGEGPRTCIAYRFAMLQVKICLAMILGKFRVRLHEDTDVPVTIDWSNWLLKPKNKILVRFEEIN